MTLRKRKLEPIEANRVVDVFILASTPTAIHQRRIHIILRARTEASEK